MRLLEFSLRFLGLLFALFIVANFAGGLLFPRFGADWIWIDLARLPGVLATAARLALAAILLRLAFLPPLGSAGRWTSAALLAAFALLAARDACVVLDLATRGTIGLHCGLSLSLLVGVFFAAETWLAFRPEPRGLASIIGAPSWRWLPFGAVAAILVALVPLSHLVTFGPTDYRRPAGAAVVPGARVHPSGEPSDALRHRLKTAVEIYREGLVPLLVLSGGTGAEGWNEADVMRDWAVARGVPPEAIVLDREGTTTEATVANTARILRERGIDEVLVVSHHFHNPRLKLAFARAGVRAYAVPAKEEPALRGTAWFMARECAALYVYYLKPMRN